MTQFQVLGRPILVAISRASSARNYAHVNGEQVMAELRALGHDFDPLAVRNTLDDLRADGFVSVQGAGWGEGMESVSLIRLDTRGRQQVEGWPEQGVFSSGDVDALIAAFERLAQDPNATPEERGLADEAADAVKRFPIDLGRAFLMELARGLGMPV